MTRWNMRGLKKWGFFIGILSVCQMMSHNGWADTTTLADLPFAAQAAMSNAIGQDQADYRIIPTADEWQAENRPHGVTARFGRDGMTIRSGSDAWQFTVTEWGYGAAQTPVETARPVADGNRVEYRRGALTEWYVNGPAGIQQGFTLAAPPEAGTGNAPLTVTLNIAGSGQANVDADGRGLTLTRPDGRDGLRYAGLYVYDADQRELPASFEIDGTTLSVRVEERAAKYPITIDPWVQQRRLFPNDPYSSMRFGQSVAISGDTAVIGAPMARIDGQYRGAAYVFVRNGSTWVQQQKLIANDGATGNEFGAQVALSGDTAVIGTSVEAVYVFVRSGTTWTQQQKLTASDSAANDYFGSGLSIDGDTIVIGAPGVDYTWSNRGAVYIYVRSGTTWTQQPRLMVDDGESFGCSVAISGDIVMIGASGTEIDGRKRQGAVYVFARSGGTWAQQQKLTASDGVAYNYFGNSIAFSGDTIVVGANLSVINNYQGAAYVFVNNGNAWIQQQKLIASDGAAGDYFGADVGISGDTAIVGAKNADVSGRSDQGAAYVFVRNGSVWTEQKLTSSYGVAKDYFGQGVAISSDTAIIGSYLEGNDQGVVYIFGSSVITTYTISGTVRATNGTGLTGVTLTGLPGNPVTSANGTYSATVSSGWSGTVTPQKVGYTFTPQNRSYTSVNSNQVNQNYTGAEPSGNSFLLWTK